MTLRRLRFNHFRNFDQSMFDFSPGLTVVKGENARGKTNLLEGIYFFVNGVGFRESREEELITIGHQTADVVGRLGGEADLSFRLRLTKKAAGVEKQYLINNSKKKPQQYLREQTKAILFAPEQIEIITGPPDKRRDYFNKQIGLYDLAYKKRLVNYENALHKRNKILETQRDEQRLKDELAFWNRYLVEQATDITQKRQAYVDFLNRHSRLDHKEFGIYYHKNEMTLAKLEEVFESERRYRRTLIGPQKDDFYFLLKNTRDKNLQHFGARSEQRLAVFWLKINEINYYEENYHHMPILLLDDIFSELDRKNSAMVVELVKKYQAVLTTTGETMSQFANLPKSVIAL
ncbi:DNA replication and repair protein RecF [Patescibacteria group bacterium]|nr:DNA replication and repair protein RecF [Patescibacteria group bacterium]MCL5091403.1 DNA replication and repair protein RecF [Patescibacteria group bacterium]